MAIATPYLPVQKYVGDFSQRFKTPPRRYLIGDKVRLIIDGSSDEISGITRRDKQYDVSPENSPIKRIISSEGQNLPLGFYLAGPSRKRPQTLELNFDYVSHQYRGQNIGLTQIADFLLNALKDDRVEKAIFTPLFGKSSFGDSLDGVVTIRKIQGWLEYEIDLTDAEKVKAVLSQNLVERGIKIL